MTSFTDVTHAIFDAVLFTWLFLAWYKSQVNIIFSFCGDANFL